MPATALTQTSAPHKYSQTGAVVTMAAADVANGNKISDATRDMLVIARNSGASARTVTITSEPLSDFQRTGDVNAQSLAAGEIRIFRLTKNGWADETTNEILLSANHAEVLFGVVDLTDNT
jgi:hypothetical protein